MKYFAIESSLNEKIMGKIPQVKEFIHSYDANEESKLIDKFIFKKIEIQPILSNAILYSNAKQTDFIDTYGNVGFLSGYLISNKFKQLLEQFNCYGIQFFPTHLIQKNKEVNGYWQTHIYDFPYDCIDFVKTEFFSKNSETMKVNFQEKLNISNANELSNIIKSLEYPNSLFIKNIFFTDKMNYDFFKLRFFENGGSYGIVSEKFKNEFEKQDCTGIEFRPIELSLQDWYHSGEREKKYGKI